MLWTRAINVKPLVYTPFVVDTETRQSGNGISLLQLLQTDGTFPGVSRQNVLIVGQPGLAETHEQVLLHLTGHHVLGAHGAAEPS